MNSNSNIGIPVVMSDYRIRISGCDVGMVTCNSRTNGELGIESRNRTGVSPKNRTGVRSSELVLHEVVTPYMTTDFYRVRLFVNSLTSVHSLSFYCLLSV